MNSDPIPIENKLHEKGEHKMTQTETGMKPGPDRINLSNQYNLGLSPEYSRVIEINVLTNVLATPLTKYATAR
jgi:hypothetical protein